MKKIVKKIRIFVVDNIAIIIMIAGGAGFIVGTVCLIIIKVPKNNPSIIISIPADSVKADSIVKKTDSVDNADRNRGDD